MIERGFVDLYSYVCRELNLNNEERHRLWLDIVREIERLEKYLADPANATDEEIRKACSDLGIPTFRTLGLKIIRMRESALLGGFGVTRGDRSRVAQRLAEVGSID